MCHDEDPAVKAAEEILRELSESRVRARIKSMKESPPVQAAYAGKLSIRALRAYLWLEFCHKLRFPAEAAYAIGLWYEVAERALQKLPEGPLDDDGALGELREETIGHARAWALLDSIKEEFRTYLKQYADAGLPLPWEWEKEDAQTDDSGGPAA